MVNLKKNTVSAWIDTLTRWAEAAEEAYFAACDAIMDDDSIYSSFTINWKLEEVKEKFCDEWDYILDKAYEQGAPELVVYGYVVRPCFY